MTKSDVVSAAQQNIAWCKDSVSDLDKAIKIASKRGDGYTEDDYFKLADSRVLLLRAIDHLTRAIVAIEDADTRKASTQKLKKLKITSD